MWVPVSRSDLFPEDVNCRLHPRQHPEVFSSLYCDYIGHSTFNKIIPFPMKKLSFMPPHGIRMTLLTNWWEPSRPIPQKDSMVSLANAAISCRVKSFQICHPSFCQCHMVVLWAMDEERTTSARTSTVPLESAWTKARAKRHCSRKRSTWITCRWEKALLWYTTSEDCLKKDSDGGTLGIGNSSSIEYSVI